MTNAIKQTKIIISKYYEKSKYEEQHYKKFYTYSNENINAYLKSISVTPNQKALSVLASGDQPFNLIAIGIKDIDTFDINKLAEYYVLGLKLAMITRYNYIEFIEINYKLHDMYTQPEEIVSIISDLIPLMDEKYREYWREIVGYDLIEENKFTNKRNHNLFDILKAESIRFDIVCKSNTYLLNEEKYNQFKANLMQSNIRFEHTNATRLPYIFDNKYDYILLSNILDYIYFNWGKYWGIKELNNYLDSLKSILNPNALIFLHYCFVDYDPINFANIYITDFAESEILSFKGLYGGSESMILKRNFIEK